MVYEVTNIAYLFHNFPHPYQSSNPSFDPNNSNYIQSLIIIAALPAVFLFIVLLFFLCYFLLRHVAETAQNRNPFLLNVVIFFFMILLCALVGLGLYGNNSVSAGIGSLIEAIRSIDDSLKSVIDQIASNYDLVTRKILATLVDIRSELSFLPNTTQVIHATSILDKIDMNIDDVIANLKELDNTSFNMHGINLTQVILSIEYGDYVRWSASVGFLCLAFLVCLLITCGVGKKSSPCLKTGAFFGILCLAVFWICLGLYLAVSVGIADFCVNPNAYILRTVKGTQKAFIKYYLQCDVAVQNPIIKYLQEGDTFIADSYNLSNTVLLPLGRSFPHSMITNDTYNLLHYLNQTVVTLDQLLSLTDCHLINKDYNTALIGTCVWSLNGMAYLLLSLLVSVVLLITIIILSSRTWVHYYRPTRRQYVKIDEQDPFLPPNSSTSDSYGSFGYKFGEETSTYPNSIYADFMISTNSNPSQNNMRSSWTGQSTLTGQSPPPAYASFDKSNLNTSQGTRIQIRSPFVGPDS